jgi:alanine racemase
MRDNSVIEIDLGAIDHNVRLLRRIVCTTGAECLICPIIKADAYGLGATRIAKTLLASGAEMLAVHTPAQATELINAAVSAAILVLMPVRQIERTDELYRGLICGRLHLAVHDPAHLDELIAIAERYGAAIPVHLEVDTGMTRGGCPYEDAAVVIRRISSHPRLKLAGLFTHFADAEHDVEFTDRQLAMFDRLIEENEQHISKQCVIHAASTFATLRAQRYHKMMVRIGLAWAGYGMDEIDGGEVIADGQHLRPCVRWISRLTHIRTVPAGTRVGYGQKWTCRRASAIGVVPVGYADGFPVNAGWRDGSERGAMVGVVLQGPKERLVLYAPVVGAVSMDQMTIDLTDALEGPGGAAVSVGMPVELISPQAQAPNHLPRLAELGGTFSHEMMCRLNPRLRRTYHMSGGGTAHAVAGLVASAASSPPEGCSAGGFGG